MGSLEEPKSLSEWPSCFAPPSAIAHQPMFDALRRWQLWITLWGKPSRLGPVFAQSRQIHQIERKKLCFSDGYDTYL
jgi:hypothetical protein